MPEVVTLGESMMVLRSAAPGPLRYSDQFTRALGGAESNLAIGIVRQGNSCGWISRLGEDEVGQYICNTIRGEGVDVSHVAFDAAHPTGMYLKEQSVFGDPKVLYYRRGSAASQMKPSDLDEAYIRSARLLHVTGITPALSASCRETVFAAIEIARSAGVKVSFDPNMRFKLWSAAEAKPVLRDIAGKADIVLPGQAEGEMLLGVSDPAAIVKGLVSLGATLVAVKLGAEGALVATPAESHLIAPMSVNPVDTVGAGDAFAAVFLAGYLQGRSVPEMGRRACVAGAIVTRVFGDWEGIPTAAELDRLVQGEDGISR